MLDGFGRVLDVNATQRAPTRPKSAASTGRSRDRLYWGSLGDVAASTRLITQRSLVQIQPPQPRKSRASGEIREPLARRSQHRVSTPNLPSPSAGLSAPDPG